MFSLSQQWQRILSKLSDQAGTTQALLTREDILDLQYRAENESLSHSSQLEVSLKKSGDVLSVYKGSGLDYDESRLYQEGDDPRNINWKLSARTNDVYLKVYREEKNPALYLLIDQRVSMQFGTRKRLKATQAARLAGYLSYKALQVHTEVYGITIGEKNVISEPLTRKAAVFAYIQKLALTGPPSDRLKRETTLSDSLALLQEFIKPGSSIFLLSDFYDLSEENRNQLFQLASENDVYALHVIDPAEWELPGAGVLNILDNSTGDSLTLDTDSKAVIEGYSAVAKHFFLSKKEIFDSLGIPYHQVLTIDDNIEDLI